MRIPKKQLLLPPLPYSYDGLEPVTSAEALKIHYEGHHGGYVKTFNKLLKNGGSQADLEFNYSGHILHSLFWQNFSPYHSQPGPKTLKLMGLTYHGATYPLFAFIQDIVSTATKIKGSGWSAGVIKDGHLEITSISNHNLTYIAHTQPLLVLDAWEHAYYLDYANNKQDFFKKIISLIDWDTLETRIS